MALRSIHKYGVVFDLDDTLLATSRVYYNILIELMMYIQDVLAPSYVHPGRIIEIWNLWELDSTSTDRAVDFYDQTAEPEDQTANPEIFPRRVAEIFIECCLEAGYFPTRDQVYKARMIGKRIYSADYLFLPGARSIIEKLHRRSDTRLFMITHGSHRLQSVKLKNRNTFKKFDKMFIVPIDMGKDEKLIELMDRYKEIDRWIMIGDSVSRDIMPALKVGITAIHVKRHMGPRDYGDVPDIGDLRKLYIPLFDLADAADYLWEVIYASDRQEISLKARV